jgi:hypothetical protein
MDRSSNKKSKLLKNNEYSKKLKFWCYSFAQINLKPKIINIQTLIMALFWSLNENSNMVFTNRNIP